MVCGRKIKLKKKIDRSLIGRSVIFRSKIDSKLYEGVIIDCLERSYLVDPSLAYSYTRYARSTSPENILKII